MSSAAGPWGQTFAESRMRNVRRSPPPCVCCELATFAVLWKLARRHHQEITLSCSRQPRRRPQPAAHSELDTRMQHGRGPKHVACQVKHTHKKKKKKKKELGASRSGPRRSFHPHGLVPRATATPPVSPAPTLQVTRRTANFGLQRPLDTGRVQRPRAARSLSQPRPYGLLQQRHAACVAQPRRWPSPAAFSLCGRRLQAVAS